MKMKYRVKLFNDFSEPYWMSDDPSRSPVVNHVCSDEYVTYDEFTFKKILADFIDAPNKKLTDKEIRNDFDTNRDPKLSNSRIEVIKKYYNGRYALKKRIDSDLAKIDVKKMKPEFPIVLKYKISFEMNYFSCNDNDPCDKLTHMNDSYIEIEILKVD